MLYALIIVSVLLVVSIGINCFGLATLLNCEDKIEKYEEYIEAANAEKVNIKTSLVNTYKRLRDIDSKGIFQKDDDVGFVFSEIVNTIEKIKDDTQ